MSKAIALTQNQFALVDDQDFDFVSSFKWCVSKCKTTGTCYAVRGFKIKQKCITIKMHRAILEITDRKIHIDHKNHNGLDNRRENLRVCSPSENLMNKRKSANKTSVFKGVSCAPNANLWRAYINKDGKRKHIGYYATEIEAAEAYDFEAVKMFGEYAFLNSFMKGANHDSHSSTQPIGGWSPSSVASQTELAF